MEDDHRGKWYPLFGCATKARHRIWSYTVPGGISYDLQLGQPGATAIPSHKQSTAISYFCHDSTLAAHPTTRLRMKNSRSAHHFSPGSIEEPAEDGLYVDLGPLSRSLGTVLEPSRSGAELAAQAPVHAAERLVTATETAFPALAHEYVIYISEDSGPACSSESSPQSIAALFSHDTGNAVSLGLVEISPKPAFAYADATKHIISVSFEAAPLLMVPDLFDPTSTIDQESILLSPLAAALKLGSDNRARVAATLSARPCRDHNSEPGLVVLYLKVTISSAKDSIASPPLSSELATKMQPDGLVPTLLPFQRRSVAWLLQREGHFTGADVSNAEMLPLGWKTIEALSVSTASENGSNKASLWYYNPSLGDLRTTAPDESIPSGGMLCEEMGLGKTVECIAMILHHKKLSALNIESSWRDEGMDVEVTPVNTTLIITPPSLFVQWMDELARHAPTLRVFQYQGWKQKPPIPDADDDVDAKTTSNSKKRKRSKTDGDEEEEAHLGFESDAWNTLRDLHFARPPVKRPRRGGRPEPVRKRSSLITIQWARVIMDEVQLMGNANTQEMVSMIPRRASFAVSGTPVSRSNTVRDLDKTLRFIGAWHSQQHWTRLLQPSFRPELQKFLDRIVVRTTKASVANELTIPPQEYFVVPIQPGPVEQHFYEMQLEAAMAELGLPTQPPTRAQLESVDVGTLRSWFRKLRMACIHPQIGHLQMHGGVVGGAFKSIDDVLKDMTYQGWGGALSTQRTLHHTQLRLSLLLQKMDTAPANEERLALLKYVHTESKLLENAVSDAIRRQDELGVATEISDTAQIQAQESQPDPKGKRKEDASTVANEVDLLNDGAPNIAPENRLGRTNWQHLMTRRSAMVNRLREIVELQHRVTFFLGDFYHQAQNVGEENRWYEEAEKVRKRLLKESEAKVNKLMDASKEFLKREAGKPQVLDFCGKGGIMTDAILNEANEAIPYLNNLQTLISQLRVNIIEYLTFPLNAEPESENNADGQEYDRALESQARIETYLQAYEKLLGDRLKVLNGQQSVVEIQKVGPRKTQRSQHIDTEEGAEPSGISPEKELQKVLEHNRAKNIAPARLKPLKLAVRDLASVEKRTEIRGELGIANTEGARLKKLVSDEEKRMSTLQAEMVTFRQTFNARIVYYRQLQALSDSVVDVEWSQDELPMLIARCRGQISDQEDELKRAQSKNRYLEFISKKMTNEQVEKEERCCQICQTEFDNGFITNCGHVFCRECMNLWLKQRHGTCPACRSPLNSKTLHRVDFRPADSEVTQEDGSPDEGSPILPVSRVNIKYRSYDPKRFAQFECHGQYGEKIQTLVRHLLWTEDQEPGSQSVVFSAWADSLSVIEHALKRNNISCIRADGSRAKSDPVQDFRDQGIQALLLHGERENSGMNITCASQVFLVEPVVSHMFELQAIARVDRLGQTRATKVFCYYCDETVEKNILDLAALQGKSLYLAQGSAAKHFSAVPEVSLRPKRVAGMRGDYVADKNDLLFCMFPEVVQPAVSNAPNAASTSPPEGVSAGGSGGSRPPPHTLTHDQCLALLSKICPHTLDSLQLPLNLTDVRLARRPDGQSRRFAFVGYKTNDEAAAAKAYFDRTYIGGSRISVELVDSTKAQEPKKKRARNTKEQAPAAATPTVENNDTKKSDTKTSKVQREFMDTFAPRAKGRSWLDNDVPLTTNTIDPSTPEVNKSIEAQSPAESDPDEGRDDISQDVQPPMMSDLDWMRSRMRKDLDADKVFTQDDEDMDEAPEQTRDADVQGHPAVEPEENAPAMQTRRLFLRNLAYVCTEEDIRAEFSRFGAIEQIHIPLTAERTPKGLAYVTFMDVDSAAQALQAMDRTSFQGRLLHIMPAITRAGKEEADIRDSNVDGKKSVKKDRDAKRKENAGREFNWGMLYMNSDAVLSSVAERLKISKAEILDPEASNASVRLALAETNVIEETKAFLETQGVSLDSFKSREKSDTIILVKNIPYGTTAEDLRSMFSPFGELSRLLLPPSGTLGIVEFVHAVDAGKAFKAIAYRRIKDSIIYLERGPAKMFSKPPSDRGKSTKEPIVSSAVEPIASSSTVEDDAEIPPGATLFVKNLAFATTDETLNSAFRTLPGFAFARVQTKPDPKRPGARLSMGFGFVGFRSVESAQRALSGMQGAVVDGHALQVKFAKRGDVPEKAAGNATIGSSKTTKMIVKNLPFEATKKDVRELFSAYGQLKSVRVPRKFNSSTRGFAFLDFVTRREAENAFSALQHTHLLGRHLVLQWAEDNGVNVEQLRDNVRVGWGDGTNVPGKKRKIDMLSGLGEGAADVDD
ncbi:RNA recognition motif protein [Ceratobasidium sp. AG-Ba]|nr:RNA recognition motif protein [Ceratobasidium sp. AG-Ba]